MSTVDEAVSGSNMPVDPARKAGKKDEEGFDNAETPLPSDMATSGNDVGLFIRILTRWPLTVVSVIFLIMMALLFGVGLPEMQTGLGGGDARGSLASKEWDAFTWYSSQKIDIGTCLTLCAFAHAASCCVRLTMSQSLGKLILPIVLSLGGPLASSIAIAHSD